ncbi:MAG: acyltransferase family protein [Candidatus Hodarchaeales archaeon]
MINSERKEKRVADTVFERKFYLDWLRIIAILLVFLYHGTKFFDGENWHLKNDIIDPNISIFMTFLTALGMPLFFIIAGMGTFFAFDFMEKRNIGNKKYISDRFIRLMIPFFIGLVSHIPLQIYFERVSSGAFTGSFIDFYLQYFDGIYEFGGNFSIFGNHLWFLVILFLFSLLTVNFFRFLRKENYQERISSFLKNPRVLFLFPFPILISELIYPYVTDIPLFGGWNIFSHLLYYILGFILAFDKQLMNTIDKHIKKAIVINFLSIIVLILIVSFFYNPFGTTPNNFPFSETFFWLFRVIFAWSGLTLILWLGNKYLNRDSKNRKFINELVLPFYILHQTVLIFFGFFIIQVELGILMKYFVIISSSFIVIFILLLIIREENTLRFFFGMRMKKEKSIRRWIKIGQR